MALGCSSPGCVTVPRDDRVCFFLCVCVCPHLSCMSSHLSCWCRRLQSCECLNMWMSVSSCGCAACMIGIFDMIMYGLVFVFARCSYIWSCYSLQNRPPAVQGSPHNGQPSPCMNPALMNAPWVRDHPISSWWSPTSVIFIIASFILLTLVTGFTR